MCRKLMLMAFLGLVLGLFFMSEARAADPNLVGYWKFDEGSGTTAYDSSGNGYNGTLIGGATWVAGRFGGGVRLNGTNSYVSVPGFALTTDTITFVAWLNGWKQNDWAPLLSSRAVNACEMNFGANNTLHYTWNNDSAATYDWTGGPVIPQDTWAMLAVTLDPAKAVAYVYTDAGGLTQATNPIAHIVQTVGALQIGYSYDPRYVRGIIDEAAIFNRALTGEEIMSLVSGIGKGYPNASTPNPANGDIVQATWVSLGWRAGDFAVSHDMYLGDNFEDVNAGTGNTFRVNQTDPFFLVGLGLPGDPYPGGLVPGTTYYWRIDEVNTVDPNSPWKGPVWSFFIPPRKAYVPSPGDGAKYQDPGVTLKWTAGLGAKLHYVFFGDNLDTISNATGGAPVGTASYTPAGPLVKGKTYYWRVDEFDGTTKYKGGVWSFTTLGDIPITDPNLVAWYKFEAGEGTRVIDFSGHNNHGTIVPGTGGTVQRVEGLFNLGLQFLGDDRGHVDLPARIVTTARGSVALWVNTNQIDDEGMFWYGTETGGDGYGDENEIHLNIDDPGQVDFYLEENGAGSDITINGPFINGAGWTHVAATWDLTDGCKLYVNGAEVGSAAHNTAAVNLAVIRLGRPVGTGNGNRYYEGLMDDVRLFNRAISAAKINEIMNKGEDPLRAGSPKPATGALAPINVATSLSWTRGEKASQHDVYFGADRDAVANAAVSDTTGVYRGRQSATSYTPPEGVQFNGGPYYWRIDEVNTDGTTAAGTVWSFSVTNYALVEDFESYNDIPDGQAGSNLVYMTWLDGFANPNANGSTMGFPTGSSLETTRVHGGRQAVPLIYNNSTAALSEVERTFAAQNWTSYGIQTLSLWFYGDPANVPGQLYVKINGVKVLYDGDASNLKKPVWQTWNITLASAGVNLQSVTRLAIGIETKGTSGTLLLDDIRLYALPRQLITPVQPAPAGLAARYAFEGNANDSAGGRNGTPSGGPTYALGKIGQAISLDGVDDYVAVSSVGISGAAPRTISGWAKMNVTTGITDWTNVFGFSATGANDLHFDIEVVGGGTTTAGYYGIHVYGWERNIMPPDLGWHHFAATYDGTTISWYGDGLLVGSAARPGLNTQGDVRIGKRIDTGGFFPGLVDEVQIFSRVLSEAEVAGLAGMAKPFDKPF